MKLIRNNKKIIFAVLITAVLTSVISVTAVKLSASDIGFESNHDGWEVDNVNDAMNDLYDLGIEASNAKIYKLGEGRSFDISSIVGKENVANYSADNFLVFWNSPECTQQTLGWNGETDNRITVYGKIDKGDDFVKSYDNTTGIVTITGGTYKLGAYATQIMSGYNYATLQNTPTVYFLPSTEIVTVD